MFHPNCILNIQILLLVLWRICIFKLLNLDIANVPDLSIIFLLLFVFQYQTNGH